MLNNIVSFLKSVKYCLTLSLAASFYLTILRVILLILSSILPYALLSANKMLLDELTYLSLSLKSIVYLIIITVFIVLLQKTIQQLISYIEKIHTSKLQYSIISNILRSIFRINIDFFDTPDYLDVLQEITKDSSVLYNVIWNIFYAINSIISFVIAFAMIASYKFSFAIILSISAIPIAILTQYFSKEAYSQQSRNAPYERQQSYIYSLAHSKANACEFRLFSLTDFFLEKYKRAWKICYDNNKKLDSKKFRFILPALLLPDIISFFLILAVVYEIFQGKKTVGDFSLYNGLFTSLISATSFTISQIYSVYEDKLKIDTISSFQKKSINSVQDGKKVLSNITSIKFVNVSFRYPHTKKYVLKNINIEVNSGEKICLIGLNGAGKSTIIKLLLGFYQPTAGEILINSININEYSRASLRTHFSVLFQNYASYALTLRDNITLSTIASNIQKTDDQIIQTLQDIGMLDLLNKMANGLDTNITKLFDKEGYEPSGGENQKISLARIFNRNAQVIILDEPNSALDPESEYKLFQSLNNLSPDKILFFTTHHLTNCSCATKILVIDNGTIVEQGSHDLLLQKRGEYAKLYDFCKNS